MRLSKPQLSTRYNDFFNSNLGLDFQASFGNWIFGGKCESIYHLFLSIWLQYFLCLLCSENNLRCCSRSQSCALKSIFTCKLPEPRSGDTTYKTNKVAQSSTPRKLQCNNGNGHAVDWMWHRLWTQNTSLRHGHLPKQQHTTNTTQFSGC